MIFSLVTFRFIFHEHDNSTEHHSHNVFGLDETVSESLERKKIHPPVSVSNSIHPTQSSCPFFHPIEHTAEIIDRLPRETLTRTILPMQTWESTVGEDELCEPESFGREVQQIMIT